VTLTRDVRRNFHMIGKTNAGDFAQRGVGLLGRHGLDLGTYAALLGSPLRTAGATRIPTKRIIGEPKRWRFGLFLDALPALPDQLIDRRHN
jgi:hypothetical protein